MMRYDPEQPPNPEDWLALDESERIRLVERYHRQAGVKPPGERVHAMFHAVVENQLALANPAAAPRALQRLQQEGLTRHEALHAIGAVLARHVGNVRQSGGEAGDARGRYEADLEGLSADLWRQRFAGVEED